MKIIVLAGGLSTERDVSLSSSAGICRTLLEKGHDAFLLDVFMGFPYEKDRLEEVFTLPDHGLDIVKNISEEEPDLAAVKASRPDQSDCFLGPNVIELCRMADITFLGLHGGEGENGKLQATFDPVSYTHLDVYKRQDYMPTSEKSVDMMYEELLTYIRGISNEYLRRAVEYYFVNDEAFIKKFKGHSAAKTVHHGFAGGLLEHTLSVVHLCEYFAGAYDIINKDLLIASAVCHDIGKTKELSSFPDNDYTDEGQLIGHIVIGVEMLSDAIRTIQMCIRDRLLTAQIFVDPFAQRSGSLSVDNTDRV